MLRKLRSLLHGYARWWITGSFEPDHQEVVERLGDLMNEMADLARAYSVSTDEIIKQAEKERKKFHKGIF